MGIQPEKREKNDMGEPSIGARPITLFSTLRVMQIKEKTLKGKRVFWLIDIYLGKEP